jgi:hypothetical protein
MARKPTDIIKLNLRFPEALRRQLERAAADNNRSLNTEIISRLETSFQPSESLVFKVESSADGQVTGIVLEGLTKELSKTLQVRTEKKS